MEFSPTVEIAAGSEAVPSKRRSLVAACIAHALHDGYADGLYAFLPDWQGKFGLSYAGLAIVRALYSGTMGGLQMPADRLLRGLSPRAALVLSTVIATAGFAIMAAPLGFPGLCAGLVVAGVGSSIQHPRGSLLVTDTYAASARRPLALYNFSGDLGKATIPAAVAVLLPLIDWRPVVGMLALLGIGVSLVLLSLAPAKPAAGLIAAKPVAQGSGSSGFAWLMTIGALDTATRMGFLLFLPLLVHSRGGGSATVGLALALLFVGGAFGKATCSWLGERLGIVGGVVTTETATAVLIGASVYLPISPLLFLLPVLGVVLNGTSTLLYGSVPELAPRGDAGRAFALFYTGVISSGGLAPIAYGAIADHSSQTIGLLAAAATAALIVPMALRLGVSLKS